MVAEFIKASEAIFQYRESHTDPSNPHLYAYNSEYEALLTKQAILQSQLIQLPQGRNDPCRCGSGLKHKKCCGKAL
ncbi:MAG TPA: hypothetical protein GYA07_14030 [Verrucomicrobia bacterium]|nr:hypothetical protein [Verrucomicrobiota bacterium]